MKTEPEKLYLCRKIKFGKGRNLTRYEPVTFPPGVKSIDCDVIYRDENRVPKFGISMNIRGGEKKECSERLKICTCCGWIQPEYKIGSTKCHSWADYPLTKFSEDPLISAVVVPRETSCEKMWLEPGGVNCTCCPDIPGCRTIREHEWTKRKEDLSLLQRFFMPKILTKKGK